ncbi:MAG: PAS domain-containing protein, partial [Bdellovibrionales bacterium]|nr:PAS domain-containing protein [Bdellovibrionales bacterium]
LGSSGSSLNEEVQPPSQPPREQPQNSDELNEVLSGIVQLSHRVEYKQLELQRQSDYVKAIINSLGESLFVFDNMSRLTRLNSPALKVTGFDRNELIGCKMSRIFPNNKALGDMDRFSQVKAMIEEGTIKDLEVFLTAQSGGQIPVFLTGSLLFDEKKNVTGCVLTARDGRQSKLIAELMEIQQDLDEMARFPRLNPSPILRIDPNGKIELANPSAHTFFGQEDLKGQYWTKICPSITPNQLVQVALLGQRLECEFARNGVTHRFTHAYDGASGSINVYGYDVTDLLKAQQQLLTSAQFSSVAELAGQIAHEINSPLGAIVLGADLIKRASEKGKLSTELMYKHLDTIMAVAERISKITSNMRRLALGINNKEVDVFAVDVLIQDTLLLLEEKAKTLCVELRYTPSPDSPMALGNQPGLSHALYTLVNSSFHLLKEERERWVEISLSESDNDVNIHIRDSSGAPKAEDLAQITRASKDLHGLEKGTPYGGLAVVKEILSRCNGHLQVVTRDSHRHLIMTLPKEMAYEQPPSSAA